MVKRLNDILKHADLSKVPPTAISALVYWWLCHVLRLPLDGEATLAQAATYLGVIAVVLTVLVRLVAA